MNPSEYGNIIAVSKENIFNEKTVNTYTIMNNKDIFIIHSSLDGKLIMLLLKEASYNGRIHKYRIHCSKGI